MELGETSVQNSRWRSSRKIKVRTWKKTKKEVTEEIKSINFTTRGQGNRNGPEKIINSSTFILPAYKSQHFRGIIPSRITKCDIRSGNFETFSGIRENSYLQRGTRDEVYPNQKAKEEEDIMVGIWVKRKEAKKIWLRRLTNRRREKSREVLLFVAFPWLVSASLDRLFFYHTLLHRVSVTY